MLLKTLPTHRLTLQYNVDMARQQPSISVSFRTGKTKLRKLDALARQQKRDRTQLIEEAIDQYIELQKFHLERIDEGIHAADRGDFATDEEVLAEFARWRNG
jgi:RHH-type transcriptional regulator, rel operon repressor / antitoxin RelB